MKKNRKFVLFIAVLTTFLNAKTANEYIKINDNGSSRYRTTEAKGTVSIAIGMNSLSANEASLSLGYNASSHGVNSLAIGRQSTSYSRSTTALGFGAIANTEGSVSIGSESNAKRGKDEYGYNILKNKVITTLNEVENNNEKLHVWQGSRGVFAVGNEDSKITRQITGVAAAKEDTDAVNLAQLKALANAEFKITNNGSNFNNAIKDVNIKFSDEFNVKKEDENIVISLKENREIKDGVDGVDGKDGKDGKSVYEIWRDLKPENANKTEKDFIDSLKAKNDNDGVANAVSLAMLKNNDKNSLTMAIGMYEKNVSFALGVNGKTENFGYNLGFSVNDKGKLAGGVGISVGFEKERDIISEIEDLKNENSKLKKMIEKIENK